MLNVGGGAIRQSDSLQADCVHALHLIAIWGQSWKQMSVSDIRLGGRAHIVAAHVNKGRRTLVLGRVG